jgi:hypothetical protein
MQAKLPAQRVLDARGEVVGQVQHLMRDPRTGTPRSVLVRLDPGAHAHLPGMATHAVLAMRFVGAVRRDELVLTQRLPELARTGALALAPPTLPLP